MPGGKSPGPSIKAPATYEALKKKGMSKTQSAKISNAQAKKRNGGKTPKRPLRKKRKTTRR